MLLRLISKLDKERPEFEVFRCLILARASELRLNQSNFVSFKRCQTFLLCFEFLSFRLECFNPVLFILNPKVTEKYSSQIRDIRAFITNGNKREIDKKKITFLNFHREVDMKVRLALKEKIPSCLEHLFACKTLEKLLYTGGSQ